MAIILDKYKDYGHFSFRHSSWQISNPRFWLDDLPIWGNPEKISQVLSRLEKVFFFTGDHHVYHPPPP